MVNKEASQTRDLVMARKLSMIRAARPDPSLRKRGLLGTTMKLHTTLNARLETESFACQAFTFCPRCARRSGNLAAHSLR